MKDDVALGNGARLRQGRRQRRDGIVPHGEDHGVDVGDPWRRLAAVADGHGECAGTFFLFRPWRRTEYPAWARARASPTPARPGPMSPIAREDCCVTYCGPSTARAAWWRGSADPAATWRDRPTRGPA